MLMLPQYNQFSTNTFLFIHLYYIKIFSTQKSLQPALLGNSRHFLHPCLVVNKECQYYLSQFYLQQPPECKGKNIRPSPCEAVYYIVIRPNRSPDRSSESSQGYINDKLFYSSLMQHFNVQYCICTVNIGYSCFYIIAGFRENPKYNQFSF